MITHVPKNRQQRLADFNAELVHAGIIGMLRGLLIGLVLGYYFMWKYNRGPNVKFFSTPYKMLYLVSWNVVGIMFTTDVARMRLSRQVALEEDIRRNLQFEEDLRELEKNRERRR